MTQSTTDFQLSISKLVAEIGAKLEEAIAKPGRIAAAHGGCTRARAEDGGSAAGSGRTLRANRSRVYRNCDQPLEIEREFSREVTRRLAEK